VIFDDVSDPLTSMLYSISSQMFSIWISLVLFYTKLENMKTLTVKSIEAWNIIKLKTKLSYDIYCLLIIVEVIIFLYYLVQM
jgi:hypothetical protein